MTAPNSEGDDDFLPLSGLQHLAFCPRQWALIHLEQAWVENVRTAEGRLLHDALLRHDIESALESVGLDPAVGFLHADRPGRPSLALDLMEELRAALADRLVLTLINRRQVHGAGFAEQDGGGIQMDDATRKQVIAAWQLRKQDEIEHPYLKERIPLGLVPYVQALLLARHIRGGLDAYPAFFWR